MQGVSFVWRKTMSKNNMSFQPLEPNSSLQRPVHADNVKVERLSPKKFSAQKQNHTGAKDPNRKEIDVFVNQGAAHKRFPMLHIAPAST